jgi:rhomboid protease GluP
MHIGFFHLISNTIGIIIFGPIMEKILGQKRFLIIYLIAGIWGNLFSFFTSYAVGAGASGALFGLAGSYAAYLYINKGNLGNSGRESLIGLSWIIGINLIFGFTVSGIDNSAHLGGLLSGWVAGLILAPKIITVFTSEEGSMPVHIEKRVLGQKNIFIWVIYIFANLSLIYLGAKIISSTFY